MSWDRVQIWRDRLRTFDPARVPSGLSPDGIREAWRVSLDAITPEALEHARRIGGIPYRRAVIVCAATVPTAPIEWCAALLGRGSRVALKHPSDDPGVTRILAGTAHDLGLPLTATPSRDVLRGADLVVAMGSDDTIRAIRAELPPDVRFEPHGHRFSVAWITGAGCRVDHVVPDGFQDPWSGTAADAALYDTRGCYSPVCVLTPLPLEKACERLVEPMRRAARRWPRGSVSPMESAAIRRRKALANAVGIVRERSGFSLHGLPAEHFTPIALPRSLAVVSVPDRAAAIALLEPWAHKLSTVGTDDYAGAEDFIALGASRVCRPGRMQRPPMVRAHDGVDWLHTTARRASNEL